MFEIKINQVVAGQEQTTKFALYAAISITKISDGLAMLSAEVFA